MRRLLLLCAGLAIATGAAGPAASRRCVDGAGVAKATCFGFHPEDATDALQAALDSGARTVIVDPAPSSDDGGDQGAGGVWVTRQLSVNRSGLTVVLQADLLAKRGAFHFVNPLNASLLSFVTSKHAPRMTADVALVGDTKALGRRPTITMWRDDYSNATPGVEYVKSEHRHGVQFDGVRNGHASNVNIRSTGG